MKRFCAVATVITAAVSLLAVSGAGAQEEAAPSVKTAPPQPVDLVARVKTYYAYGLFTAGMSFYADKEKKEALAAFQLAAENDPSLGRPVFHEGDSLFELGEFAGALKCYARALKLEPDYFFTCYNAACAVSRSGDQTKALGYIEQALKLGYDRFDKLEADDDLKAARAEPGFATLLEKYRTTPVKQTAVSEFLLADDDGKEALLAKLLPAAPQGGKPDAAPEHWKELADKALLQSSERVRVLGITLYAVYGKGPAKLDVLARGLYDANGYVNKAAGNAMVAQGKAAAPYAEAIMASDYKQGKFYAEQVLKLLKEKDAKAPDVESKVPAS